MLYSFFFLMILRPPRSTRTDTLFPYTTLFRSTDADIETMRKGLNVAIDIRNSAPLHFALGRALHDRKHYAEAFDHYREGNRQRAESIGYDAREIGRAHV